MVKAYEIFTFLNSQDEDIRIEAKNGSKVDRSIMETICSFSNEPGLGGGDIILGIAAEEQDTVGNEGKKYTVVGVVDPDKIQSDLANNCGTMFNVRVRPIITVEKLEGKNVVIVSVPELEDRTKPLYFKNEGLPRGAYRRIGPTDQRCTDDDMPLFYNSTDSYDSSLVDDTSMDDLDENAIERYRILRAKVNAQAEELDYNDRDLMCALGACKKDKDGTYKLTYTGLLVFGKSMAQRRLIPAVRVDYIRVPGTQWVANPEERFDTLDMRGPLILLVKRAYNAIVDDLPRGFVLEDGKIQASSHIGLPEKTIREAIVNALIHRSYRVNQPVQIIRYSNRIEIVNPGFSLKSEESLGEPGSILRNPFISAIFHETNLAETKGSGINVMRKLMKAAGMIPPTFDSDHTRNQFSIRLLLHHFLCEEDVQWLVGFDNLDLTDEQKLAIVFVREVGAIDNLTYRQLGGMKSHKATRELTRLASLKLLEMKHHGNQTYYLIGDSLVSKIEEYNRFKSGISNPPSSNSLSTDLVDSNPPSSDSLSTDLVGPNPPSSSCLSTNLVDPNPSSSEELPTDLQVKIASIGMRTKNKDLIKDIVVELCRIQERSITEIAKIIHRTDNYVKHDIVAPLREQGILDYTFPEMINHPNQKYKIKDKKE